MVRLAVGSREVRLYGSEGFLAHVGRVPHHRVESGILAEWLPLPVEEDLRELQLPVEEAAGGGYLCGGGEPLVEPGRGVGDASGSVVGERSPQRAVHLDPETARGGRKVREAGVAAGQALAHPGVEPLLLLDLLHRIGGALLDQPHRADRRAYTSPEGVVFEHRELGVVCPGLLLAGLLAGAGRLQLRDARPDEGIAAA